MKGRRLHNTQVAVMLFQHEDMPESLAAVSNDL